jgi:hypothetical protein
VVVGIAVATAVAVGVGFGPATKVAFTVVLSVTVSLHGCVPEHPPPDQPLNVHPLAGDAVSVTVLEGSRSAEHVAPQSMPPASLLTVPEPVTVTVSVGFNANVAVTVSLAVTVVVHVPVPEQPPPDQPVNADPAAGEAVNVTALPASYTAEQLAPQSIPPVLEATDPVPVPAVATVSVGVAMNIASMSRSVLSVIVHVPVPEQPPPDQPPKREPAFGVAVIVVVSPSLPP